MTRPKMSSMIAAPRIAVPARPWSRFSSLRTAAVIPTLVAVKIAPQKSAARTSRPAAIAIKTPPMNGMITPPQAA